MKCIIQFENGCLCLNMLTRKWLKQKTNQVLQWSLSPTKNYSLYSHTLDETSYCLLCVSNSPLSLSLLLKCLNYHSFTPFNGLFHWRLLWYGVFWVFLFLLVLLLQNFKMNTPKVQFKIAVRRCLRFICNPPFD